MSTGTHNIYVQDPVSQYIIIRITITVATTIQLQSTLFHSNHCVNHCVKVKISHIGGYCDLPSIIGNSVGPVVIASRAPPTLIILELGEKQKPF